MELLRQAVLIMALGANVAGQIGSVVAAGVILGVFAD